MSPILQKGGEERYILNKGKKNLIRHHTSDTSVLSEITVTQTGICFEIVITRS